MHPARHTAAAPDMPPLAQPDSAARSRVSGPGLRSFRRIADLWGLSETQRIAALGHPARSTYHSWMQKALRGDALTLPFDTLLRISAMLGIHKGLAILFHDDAQALQWLTGAHAGTVFRGAAPLEFVVDGGQDGMMTVRRYLDAWRGGATGQGAPEGSYEPVRETDVVFL